MAKADLTAQRLRELLEYCPATGVFKRLVSLSNRSTIGSEVGCKSSGGHLQICLDGRKFYAHRLAWLHFYGVWPAGHIDHINGIPDSNGIGNLRDATRSINMQNQRAHQGNNRHGFFGVSFDRGRWKAQIQADGKKIHLGRFDSPDEAHAAYIEAKRRLHEGCTI